MAKQPPQKKKPQKKKEPPKKGIIQRYLEKKAKEKAKKLASDFVAKQKAEARRRKMNGPGYTGRR